MARSERRLVLLGSTALLAFGGLACNAILGLSDFDKVECSGPNGLSCPDDAGIDVRVTPTEAGTDAGDAGVTTGSPPAAWANWKMPSWEGGLAPTPDYRLTGASDEVLEATTNLVWRKDEQGSFQSIEAAKAKCASLTNGPWRLPKRIELVTLVDPTRGETPAMIAPVFTAATKARYWTSSEVRPSTSPKQYWVVDFTPPTAVNRGAVLTSKVTETTADAVYLRCVKDKP